MSTLLPSHIYAFVDVEKMAKGEETVDVDRMSCVNRFPKIGPRREYWGLVLLFYLVFVFILRSFFLLGRYNCYDDGQGYSYWMRLGTIMIRCLLIKCPSGPRAPAALCDAYGPIMWLSLIINT